MQHVLYAKRPTFALPPDNWFQQENYTKVAEFPDDVTDDSIFEAMNLDPATHAGKAVRSMSVGDCIMDDDGDITCCAPLGWQRLNS